VNQYSDFLPNQAAPLTPLASPYLGFKKIVLIFFSFSHFSVIFFISSKNLISLETPPPKTITSGSIVLINKDKLLDNLSLNFSINSAHLLSFLLIALLNISFAENFELYVFKNNLSNPLPDK